MTQSSCEEKYLNLLKEIVVPLVDTDKVTVFLFGSRVHGHHASRSDADIGVFADQKLPEKLFHEIRNAIDASIVPWDVDIIDFTRADSAFKQEALKDIVIWSQPKAMKKRSIP